MGFNSAFKGLKMNLRDYTGFGIEQNKFTVIRHVNISFQF